MVSARRASKILELNRSGLYRKRRVRGSYPLQDWLVEAVRKMIDRFPKAGIRMITARLRDELKKLINRKAVARILKLKGWLVKQRPKGFRPRTKGMKSRAELPNQRWAIDTTHFMTKKDGWCHLTAIIDCCDRQIIGWRVSKSGKAKVAQAVLEDALVHRRPAAVTLRSDNGLVFASKAFQKTARGWNVSQEYITPYTPEQNGMIERWFRTVKEECIWLQNFDDIAEAQKVIGEFIEDYNNNRPHRALGMLSPVRWSQQQKYAA